MFDKDTTELFHELKKDSDIENFLDSNQSEMKIPLHEYLNQLLRQKNLEKSKIVKNVIFDDTHAYHILSGKKNPSRESLIAIARAMELNLEETQYLLRYGGFAILYPRNPRDAILISAIEKNMSVINTNSLLKSLGEKILVS